jgi:hypothetical protein
MMRAAIALALVAALRAACSGRTTRPRDPLAGRSPPGVDHWQSIVNEDETMGWE